jgi:hypothetical protein
MCHDSLVGETLRGTLDQTMRLDLLYFDTKGIKIKYEVFDCLQVKTKIKFLKLVCPNSTSADYKVDLKITTSDGKVNTIPCVASVDSNKNIRIIAFERIDLDYTIQNLPNSIQVPNIFQDVLYNLDVTFTKQKCKYQASGKFTISYILTEKEIGSLEINGVSLINSSDFKFVK